MTTSTATRLGPIFTGLAAIHGFMRAVAGDLPDPSSVSVHDFGSTVHLLFDELDDLRQWAAYSQVPVVPHDARERHQAIHHRAETTWGPVNGEMVRFDMVHIEHVPVPSVETYECEKCGAMFGIAGSYTGSPEDDAAEEFHREEIQRHESGECVAAPRDCESVEF
jgi:hypothetical protein